MSNTQFVKNQMDVTANRVISTLGITRDAYMNMHYNSATEWLLNHFANDTLIVDEVMQKKEFWSWWALQAYHRDNQWLNSITHINATYYERNRLIADWIYYHSVGRLSDMANKHAQILFNSYANINWI